jgi:hypothetical protein
MSLTMFDVPPPISTPPRDLDFLNALEAQLGALDRRIKIAELAVFTGRNKKGSRELRERRALRLLAPRMLDWISEARARASSGAVERRMELLRRHVVDCQLEHSPSLARQRAGLQLAFSAEASRLRGRKDAAAIFQAVYQSKDRREREKAFRVVFGRDRVLDGRTLALVRSRVDHCRELGQGSLASARLAMEGLTLGQWNDLSSRLIPIVRSRILGRRSRFQDRTGERGWYPWDQRHLDHLEVGAMDPLFPAGRAVPEAMRATKGWGFPRKAYRFTTRSGSIPFGGYALAVRVPDDVRVIVNPRAGWNHHRLVCHEVGHAIQACLTEGESFLLRDHDFMASYGGGLEGVGAVFERAMSAPLWLRSVRGLSKEQAIEVRERAEERFWSDLAMTLTHTETEIQAYLHPDRDPALTRYRLERQVYAYDSYSPTGWANAIHVESPLYFKSYVLGAMFSTQILRAGLDSVGGDLWPNPKLGPWLTEKWFAPGASYDWVPRVAELTGHPLGVQDLSWN